MHILLLMRMQCDHDGICEGPAPKGVGLSLCPSPAHLYEAIEAVRHRHIL